MLLKNNFFASRHSLSVSHTSQNKIVMAILKLCLWTFKTCTARNTLTQYSRYMYVLFLSWLLLLLSFLPTATAVGGAADDAVVVFRAKALSLDLYYSI